MSLESELTCSICLQIYQDPVVLSCMHSYCRECLKDLHSKSDTDETFRGEPFKASNTLSCPDCRVTTSFGLEGVDGLPKNFTLANICRTFKETLHKPPFLASSERRSTTPSTRKICYCFACQVIVRSGDLLTTHRCHVTEDIDTAMTHRKAKLSTCIPELERSRNKNYAKLKTASHEHYQRQEYLQKQEDEINSLADLIEEHVRSRRKEVLGEIETLKTHNKTNFEVFQGHLQSYISTVDTITAAAHALDGQSLDTEEGQAVFVQVAEDVLVQTVQLPRIGDITYTCGVPRENYRKEFAENLRRELMTLCGTCVAPTGLALTPCKENRSTQPSLVEQDVSIGEAQHVDNRNNAESKHTSTADNMFTTEPSPVDDDDDDQWVTESDTGSEYSSSAENAIIFTGRRFVWDTLNCHASLAVSEDRLVVTDDAEDIQGPVGVNQGSWIHVRGIASNTVFEEGNFYWEISITLSPICSFYGLHLITDIGICKSGKEDVYSPLSRNYYCYCCSLLKASDSPGIVMKFWDGSMMTRSESTTVRCTTVDNNSESLELGFHVNFQNKMFRIIDVNENIVLHTFENMSFPQVTAVASIENGHRVMTNLELDSDVDVFPSIL